MFQLRGRNIYKSCKYSLPLKFIHYLIPSFYTYGLLSCTKPVLILYEFTVKNYKKNCYIKQGLPTIAEPYLHYIMQLSPDLFHSAPGKMRTLLIIASFVIATQALRSPPRVEGVKAVEPRASPEYYRLPTNVVPSEYTLLLEPFLQNDTFNGNVIIKVNVEEATDEIILHAVEIEFVETSVFDESGSRISIQNETVEEDRDFRILHFASNLTEGEYTIRIDYVGQLNGHNDGFYRSNYTNSANELV